MNFLVLQIKYSENSRIMQAEIQKYLLTIINFSKIQLNPISRQGRYKGLPDPELLLVWEY